MHGFFCPASANPEFRNAPGASWDYQKLGEFADPDKRAGMTALTKVFVETCNEMFNDGVKLKVFEMRGYMTKVTKICIYFVFILRRQNLKAIP